MKIKLLLDRNCCIDCGACIPEFFDKETDEYLFEETEEVHLVNSKKNDDNTEEIILDVSQEKYNVLMAALEVCPTEAILIELLD